MGKTPWSGWPQAQGMDQVQSAATKTAQAVQDAENAKIRQQANQDIAARLAASSFSRAPELERDRQR